MSLLDNVIPTPYLSITSIEETQWPVASEERHRETRLVLVGTENARRYYGAAHLFHVDRNGGYDIYFQEFQFLTTL